jgi:HPt (histidine-containing phosphotransfer) domain-containing protein
MPSVLLADLRMPGISGRDLAVALRAAAPHAKLLAMSATADPADGYDGFLKKPLDLASLQAALLSQESGLPESSHAPEPETDLDEAVYAKLLRMMPGEAVREVYETCLSDARARAEGMRVACETNDLASLRLIAHAVKGGAGMVGAQKLAAAAATIELGVYQQDDVPQLVDNLLSSCDRLQRILLAKL